MKCTSKIIYGIIILVMGIGQSLPAKTVIRADIVQYEVDKILFKSDEAFIITSLPSGGRRPCADQTGQVKKDPAQTGSSSISTTCALPVPRFGLDSTELSRADIDWLLTKVQQCHIGLDTPVHVTGHACRLGTKAHNNTLSLQRAERVADLLRRQGYTIGEVIGKGSEYPVAGEDNLAMNRRVELKTCW